MLELELLQLVDRPLLLARLLVSNLATGAASLPERPALAPWFRLVRDGHRLLLEHGGALVTFEGTAVRRLLPALVPLLDGSRTVEGIVEELGEPVAPATNRALKLLAHNGLLLDGPQPRPTDAPAAGAAAFVAAATRRSISPAEVAELASARVAVAGSSQSADLVAGLLRDSGLDGVTRVDLDDDETDGLLVVAPGRAQVGELRGLNQRRLAVGGPWLQVLPHDGRNVVVGPLFLPGSSGCYACYRLRRGACSGYEPDFELLEVEPTRAASTAAVDAIAAGLAATIAVRWLAVRDTTLPGRLYTFETGIILALGYHHLHRVPRCPVCGPGDAPMPSPWFKATGRAG